MKIGDTIVLHNVPFPQNSRKGDVEDKFVLIGVIEEKSVRGNWGDGEYKGYRALGADGRHYLLNWNSFPDDSTSPEWCWQLDIDASDKTSLSESIANNDVMWFDVTQGMQFIPFKPKWLDDYAGKIDYCAAHQRLSYPRNGCFWCENEPSFEPPKDYSWLGWK
jgi:hypothetical protein